MFAGFRKDDFFGDKPYPGHHCGAFGHFSCRPSTIISTAMSTIIGRLGGMSLFSWVFSIYLLTGAVTTPIFGKLADLYGRRRVFAWGGGDLYPWLGPLRAFTVGGRRDYLSNRLTC
ncbi:MAG: MFS transporter [Desulfotomaculaceae bacterium]|nr:MFS transporter [Desulfotomaculaceae bacterium]